MKGRNIISIKDCSKEEILTILERANEMKQRPSGSILNEFILGNCFFEPSTRTRLSFESAMKRLGGEVIGFSETESTSTQKGESLSDAMKIMGYYSDIIVIRHPRMGSAKEAAAATDVPVINGGDGANEHPTQTLIDLFTILECQGRLHDLKVAFVGDLLHGRTVHSLALALSLFENRLYFVSPPSLELPPAICQSLKLAGIPFSFHPTIEEVIGKVDILFMNRIQAERFSNSQDYLKLKDYFILVPQMLDKVRPNLKILHPLPRVGEIDPRVDSSPYAYYFKQAQNGLWVRQATLSILLGK